MYVPYFMLCTCLNELYYSRLQNTYNSQTILLFCVYEFYVCFKMCMPLLLFQFPPVNGDDYVTQQQMQQLQLQQQQQSEQLEVEQVQQALEQELEQLQQQQKIQQIKEDLQSHEREQNRRDLQVRRTCTATSASRTAGTCR